MLSVQNISKSYGLETILDKISFTLNSGERLGVVGPNGSGKSTLLRILVGYEQADGGSIRLHPASLPIGYLPQGLTPESGQTLAGFLANSRSEPDELEAEVERLAIALVTSPEKTGVQEAYDAALARLVNASEEAGRAPAVLAALGLDEIPPEMPVEHLSGGQKTRLVLARVLLDDPQLLLLDEPTNHLDIEMLNWLENWLNSFRGGALIVSHDRAFLDRTATAILELDLTTHTARSYSGGYSAYLEQKLAERERQYQAYQDQQEEISRLKKAIGHLRGLAKMRPGGKADSGDKFAAGFFANRSRGTVARSKQLERRVEKLMTGERIEKPGQSWQMKLDFGEGMNGARQALLLEDLSIGYDQQVLLSGIHLHLRHGARAVLVGPNGCGKTTLLRTIAGLLPPVSGKVRVGSGLKVGYMRQEQEALDPDADAFTTVRKLAPLSETQARSFLHKYLFSGDDVFVPVGRLSYGERARLSLACLVATGCTFLLLDEPVNHLDIPSRARFELALANFEGAVLAVVHDRFFIQSFARQIWEVRSGEIHSYEVEPGI